MGESYEASNGRTATVKEVRIVKLIRSVGAHLDVSCRDDHQFAVVDVDATDADGTLILTDIWFAFEVEGVAYPPAGQQWYWAFQPRSHYPRALPAFPVPVSDATNAAVIWIQRNGPSVRWELPPATVDLLNQAPRFVVRDFETPDSASRGATFEASFTVANIGERDGRFITELGAGPLTDYEEVMFDIPAGTERTRTELVEPDTLEHRDEIEVTLDWGCDRLHRTLTVSD